MKLLCLAALICGCSGGAHGADIKNIRRLSVLPDGTIRAQVDADSARLDEPLVPVSPLRGPGVIAPLAGEPIPRPKSPAIELARLSDEELASFCLVRQQRILYLLRRVEGIRLSLDIWRQRMASATPAEPDVNTAIVADALIVKTSLVAEDASRRAEYRMLRPEIEAGLLEQARRGHAVEDLPSLMGNVGLRPLD